MSDRVEAVARAIATEFGYEWVFESDTTEENYDAAYWRHVAAKALAAAEPPEPTAYEGFVREGLVPILGENRCVCGGYLDRPCACSTVPPSPALPAKSKEME